MSTGSAPVTGLSAFPLTPLVDDSVDEAAFARLIGRLADARVDSITALGSTGSYAYLSADERFRVAQLAVEHARGLPVFVGIGALRTAHVLANAANAEKAGASGVLLSAMTYQPLTDNDVFELFRAVTEHSSLPVIVYDNPGTTHFAFTVDLYGRIAELPGITSIKIPGVPADPGLARARVSEIRAVLPEHVTIGVSGDAAAANGLIAGCDAWYSVLGGTLPQPALDLTRAALAGRDAAATAESDRLSPLWELYTDFGGSIRVIAAIAEHLGLVSEGSLPLPIQGLDQSQRARVQRVCADLHFRA
ncbi:dihydrodipicolinate synthase family protein [Tomitella biformata]|uniref:dihydrodipicolinate synthase family protein n=1 Tax=Tomitella biformata TaxID=630403 RepID=UPI00056E1DE8|nr:dihydrodipicolinate synthase family protein [Tomitella biformata]